MEYYFQETFNPRASVPLRTIFELEDEPEIPETNVFLASLFKNVEPISPEQAALDDSTLRAMFEEIDLNAPTPLQKIFATSD
jgi:hypothetical protein